MSNHLRPWLVVCSSRGWRRVGDSGDFGLLAILSSALVAIVSLFLQRECPFAPKSCYLEASVLLLTLNS